MNRFQCKRWNYDFQKKTTKNKSWSLKRSKLIDFEISKKNIINNTFVRLAESGKAKKETMKRIEHNEWRSIELIGWTATTKCDLFWKSINHFNVKCHRVRIEFVLRIVHAFISWTGRVRPILCKSSTLHRSSHRQWHDYDTCLSWTIQFGMPAACTTIWCTFMWITENPIIFPLGILCAAGSLDSVEISPNFLKVHYLFNFLSSDWIQLISYVLK